MAALPRWSDADSSVVLQMSEAQLLQKLCPQRESSPSFRRWEAEKNMG
jgi:hypothetical protein